MPDTPIKELFDRCFAAHRVFDGTGKIFSNGTIRFLRNECIQITANQYFTESRNTIFHSGTLFPSLNPDSDFIIHKIRNKYSAFYQNPLPPQLEKELLDCTLFSDSRIKWTCLLKWILINNYPGNFNDWISDFCIEPIIPGKNFHYPIWWIDKYDYQNKKPMSNLEIRETIL